VLILKAPKETVRHCISCSNSLIFNDDFHQANQLASFQINFIQESKSGEEIELLIHENHPESHVILARSKTNGKDVFAAELGWKKIAEMGG